MIKLFCAIFFSISLGTVKSQDSVKTEADFVSAYMAWLYVGPASIQPGISLCKWTHTGGLGLFYFNSSWRVRSLCALLNW